MALMKESLGPRPATMELRPGSGFEVGDREAIQDYLESHCKASDHTPSREGPVIASGQPHGAWLWRHAAWSRSHRRAARPGAVACIGGPRAARGQLKEKRYADKYRGSGQPICLIAVEFSRETRNLATFEVEHA